ncbi:hypothetical protein K227x_44380 [Rubripirellula lacrimiformis]|uniref:Uncharacterized protein n=1 Tax=Rubripirellula lacrimiformis TaxID=1930273 RepID=A0A517NG00_9BACT|nr:hypothetical protein K227x_44380 [Rubripirellula lacrimiformis]
MIVVDFTRSPLPPPPSDEIPPNPTSACPSRTGGADQGSSAQLGMPPLPIPMVS